MSRTRAMLGLLVVAALGSAAILATGIAGAAPPGGPPGQVKKTTTDATATPIKHVVVIFQENVSFDHYFGTYPNASGGDGQSFAARPGTPAVAGLTPATDPSIPASLQHSSDLTTALANPNSNPPLRLDSSPDGLAGGAGGQETCDQDHNYSDEQQSFDSGKMDQFVQAVGAANTGKTPNGAAACNPAQVMDYYDGNSTTALWNYAQHFSMSDNSFGTTFGPSAPGAINLVSGDTGGVDTAHEAGSVTVADSTTPRPNADVTADGSGGFSLTSDAQPYWDDCSTRDAVALKGTNIGDELNAAGLSWGWFQGGFRPSTSFADAISLQAIKMAHPNQTDDQFFPDEFSGTIAGKYDPPAIITNTHSSTVVGLPTGLGKAGDQGICNAYHAIGVALGATSDVNPTDPSGDNVVPSNAAWGYKDDYIAHHEPFQYYASTANPHHLAPASLASIGTDTQSYVAGKPQFDTANHNYDTSDFDSLMSSINAGKLPASALPAVTFLKAPGYQDGHAQYSNPRDEQVFVTDEINALMASPDWSSTVVFVNYDDSDGWYDHVYSGVTNPSMGVADNLTNTKTGKITLANPVSGQCGPTNPQTPSPLAGQQGRCGYGPRLPMLAISPCATSNTVDHNLSSQASIINFIEYNWNLPAIPGSFDQVQKTLDASEGVPFDLAGMFDFSSCDQPALPLNPTTGQIDLHGADLRGDHQGDDYANGSLSNTNLDHSNLQGAFLAGTNLSGASLHQADLEGATLSGANLSGADLSNADLTGAKVNGVTWSNTTCPDHSNSSSDGGTCVGHLGH